MNKFANVLAGTVLELFVVKSKKWLVILIPLGFLIFGLFELWYRGGDLSLQESELSGDEVVWIWAAQALIFFEVMGAAVFFGLKCSILEEQPASPTVEEVPGEEPDAS